MTNLMEQKKEMDWYDQEKVNEMGFDDLEWIDACNILDDPDISDEIKKKTLDKYVSFLFKCMGVEGY